MKFPDTPQKITVYLAVRDRNKGWLERDAAVLVLELFYTTKPFQGRLELTVINADLTRDTEVFG